MTTVPPSSYMSAEMRQEALEALVRGQGTVGEELWLALELAEGGAAQTPADDLLERVKELGEAA